MKECTICSEQVSNDAQLTQSCRCVEKKCICHQCYIMWQKKTAVETPELCMYCRSPHKDMSALVSSLLPGSAAQASYLFADRLLILLCIFISIPAVTALGLLGLPGKLLFLYALLTATAYRISGFRFPDTSGVLSFKNHRLVSSQNLETFDVRAEELDYFIRISWTRLTIVAVGAVCTCTNYLPLYALSFFVAVILIGAMQGLREALNPESPISLVIRGALALARVTDDYDRLSVRLIRQYSVYADILNNSFFLDYMVVCITVILCSSFENGYILTSLVGGLLSIQWARSREFSPFAFLISAITIAYYFVDYDVFCAAPYTFMVALAISTFFDLVAALLSLREITSASDEVFSSVSLRTFIHRFDFQVAQ